jgi:CubicO group peptidase (beta-lactamase class C family)
MVNMFGRGLAIAGVVFALACCAVSPVTMAQNAIPELTRTDVEAWLDGYLPYAMKKGDIAGAVVVVVRDGQVLLQKGYGYSDVAARQPVDPDKTLFRIGSISKLFTWTAIMQLVERGKLNLDGDVNGFLDFQIPAAFGKPILLRNLMTHSGGFEETLKGMIVYEPTEALTPIGAYVKAHVPARIYPPGKVSAYSNYATTLAGYMVERASGEPYTDYIEHHILRPLEMLGTSAQQPLPPSLRSRLSKGYVLGSESPQPFEGIVPAPAGSLSATGADMARFMIAHLQDGRYAGAQILRPETARLMHAPAFHSIPSVNGMTLGFFQQDRNGHRIIGHSGDTGLFHSDLRLYLDEGVGLFMSVNSSGKELAADGVRTALFQQFTDRYFPAPMPVEEVVATAMAHARLLEGSYSFSRESVNSFMNVAKLFQQSHITAHPDGTLSVSGEPFADLNGKPKVWREVAPFVWRERDGRERLAAKVEDGRVVAVSTDSYAGIMVLLPVAAWKSADAIALLITAAVSVLLLTLFAWPMAAIMKWQDVRRAGRGLGDSNGTGADSTSSSGSAREVSGLKWVRITAAVDLVFLAGWMSFIVAGSSVRSIFDASSDPWLRLLQMLGLIGVLGAAGAVWHTWRMWTERHGMLEKIWNLAVAAACCAIVWFAFAFKLITVSLNY